ncbi:MAG: glycogen debranching enzyme family protein [Anaerolineaceae bacterium]|nr:glycogen debranching enzyme family protein [Anaerolineaceae bacterium]
MFELGRDITNDPTAATAREWLVTNGIGGYASGTVSGALTRTYHATLVAALKPPLGRIALFSKFDEMAVYDGQRYDLYTNQWYDQTACTPKGYTHIERFYLDDAATPTWEFAIGDARLRKRIWMQYGSNTTYVQYTLLNARQPLRLEMHAMLQYRDHHAVARARNWKMMITPVEHGLQVDAYYEALPYYLLSDAATIQPEHTWYQDYWLSKEAYRGLPDLTDSLYGGFVSADLEPGQSVTMVISTEPDASLDGDAAYAAYAERAACLIKQAQLKDVPDTIKHLVLAADQFIVRRVANGDMDGRSVIAGYPWFSDWGRDTMIALPGLAIATGREREAARILRTYSNYISQGMLPNTFPNGDDEPGYNTVDAMLWYFNAIAAYYEASSDLDLVRDLYPILQDVIRWHQEGTRYGIRVDSEDGLLYAGEEGINLTWMDAKIEAWVVTPRQGKAVEINALWYNALRHMADFARLLGETDADEYDSAANLAQSNFGKFWYKKGGYCYDVIDGPDGADATLRPNQIFAVSLPNSPLSDDQQKAVVEVCSRDLLTSYGLRSLSPHSEHYAASYGGDPFERDSVYHQGPVWGWLIGPYVEAYARVTGDKAKARAFLQPLLDHLGSSDCIGSMNEIFDGDAPHTPRGAFAQAWTVAEVLRTWRKLSE